MERIEIKKELKLIKAFSGIFKESTDPKTELKSEIKVSFMDPANVCMIVLKSDQAKDIFKRFIDKDDELKTDIPKLDYYPNKNTTEIKIKYCVQYLSKIIKCFESIDESPKIKINTDYPIYFECEHFDFILAPRVGED